MTQEVGLWIIRSEVKCAFIKIENLSQENSGKHGGWAVEKNKCIYPYEKNYFCVLSLNFSKNVHSLYGQHV